MKSIQGFFLKFQTIPRAFLEVIPGAGHDLMLDAALEVCHSIHRFIKRWKHQV